MTQANIATIQDLENLEERLIRQFSLMLSDSRHSQPEFITQAKLMELLDISENTARALRESGQLPFSKVGHKVYFAYADVKRMLEENRRVG